METVLSDAMLNALDTVHDAGGVAYFFHCGENTSKLAAIIPRSASMDPASHVFLCHGLFHVVDLGTMTVGLDMPFQARSLRLHSAVLLPGGCFNATSVHPPSPVRQMQTEEALVPDST